LLESKEFSVVRRTLLQTLAAFVALPALTSRAETKPAPDFPPLSKSEDQWKALLQPAQFGVLFQENTERPFSSPLNAEKHAGTFVCAACFLPLFDSSHKFDSGTGWPSFTQPIAGHIDTKKDFKLVLPRTEYHCARCLGHQGHVFNDGPPPRGERWCNNGIALLFVPQGETLPALRT
jgi:peptide-methionine (R)-S-oxide reductase